MEITAAQIKALRDETGAGMMDCKAALQEAQGDAAEAKALLRKKGVDVLKDRDKRAADQGVVASYIHGDGRIGVLVEVNCESDFVARTEEFQAFAREMAMQIAATAPTWVDRAAVDEGALEAERAILAEQAKAEGKPDHIAEKMVEGRLRKFYEERCLLEQPYMRDDKVKVEDLVNDMAAKTGERVAIRRFARFVLGQKA
jgi:elongation factor Ts